MRRDAVALRKFYASPLGRAARRMLIRRLTALWPEAAGLDMLGYGFATPFLSPYAATARRVIAAMPAPQGAEPWPREGARCTVLAGEPVIPFMDSVFDRIIVAHVLEEADSLRAVTEALWRVAAPEARFVFIVANRRGLWSRIESTPFGHGRSFTRAQLRDLLRSARIEPVAWSRALYLPPVGGALAARAVRSVERVGERVVPRLGGALLVEAVKRQSAPVGLSSGRSRVFAPAGAPVAAPRTPLNGLAPAARIAQPASRS